MVAEVEATVENKAERNLPAMNCPMFLEVPWMMALIMTPMQPPRIHTRRPNKSMGQ